MKKTGLIICCLMCLIFIGYFSSVNASAATHYCKAHFVERNGSQFDILLEPGKPFGLAYLYNPSDKSRSIDLFKRNDSTRNYGFDGWFSGDEKLTMDTIVPDQETWELNQRWEPGVSVQLITNNGKYDGLSEIIVFAHTAIQDKNSQEWLDFIDSFPIPENIDKLTHRPMGFLGWEFRNETYPSPSENNTYKFIAQWDNGTPTIRFDGNGATSGSMQDQYCEKSGSIILQSNQYARDGYAFAGWNTKRDGSGYAYKDGSTIYNLQSSFILYAQWEESFDSVYFNLNGAPSGEEAEINSEIFRIEVGKKYGNFKNLPDNVTRPGYNFSGWYTKATDGTKITNASIVKSTHVVNGVATLYAHWKPIEYTIKYSKNGGSGDSITNKTCKFDTEFTLSSKKFTKTGFTHTGWYRLNNDGSKTHFDFGQTVVNLTNVSETITLFAEWTPKRYYTSYDANGGKGSMVSSYGNYNETIFVKGCSYVRDGYTFDCWNTKKDGSGTVYKENARMVITGEKKLYAQWKANEYPIYFDVNGGEKASEDLINSTAHMQVIGKKYTDLPKASSLIREGYYSDAWYTKSGVKVTASTVATAEDVSMVNDKEVIVLFAHWNPNKYTIKYNKNGSSDTTTISQTTAYFDTPVVLTSKKYSRSGYVQNGWTNASGTVHYGFGETVLNLTTVKDGTVTLYADWEANTYTMKLNLNGGDILTDENGNVISETEYVFGDTYWGEYLKSHTAIPVPQRYGYTFTGWYTSKDGTTKITESKKSDKKGLTAYAHWKVNTYSICIGATYNKYIPYENDNNKIIDPVDHFGYTVLPDINTTMFSLVTKSWKYDKSSTKKLPVYPDDDEYAILVGFNTKEDGTGAPIPLASKYTDVVKIVEKEAGEPVTNLNIYEVWEGKGCYATLMDDGSDVGGTYWGTYGEYWENKFPTLHSSEKTFVGWYDIPDDNNYNQDFSEEKGIRINTVNSADPTKYITKVDKVGNIKYYAHWMSNDHNHESKFYSDGSGDLIVLWDCEIEGCKIKGEKLNPYQYFKLRQTEETKDYQYIDAIVEFFEITGCIEEQINSICAVYDSLNPLDDYNVVSKSQINNVLYGIGKIDELLYGKSPVLTAELKASKAYSKYNDLKFFFDMNSLLVDLFNEGSEWGDVDKNDMPEKASAWLKICGKGLTKVPGFGKLLGAPCNAIFNELSSAILSLLDRGQLRNINNDSNNYLLHMNNVTVTYTDYDPASDTHIQYEKSIFEVTASEWGDSEIYDGISENSYYYKLHADKYKNLRTFYEIANYGTDNVSPEGFAQYCADYTFAVLCKK